jgi:Ni,Fe-hydrogenase III large subunit
MNAAGTVTASLTGRSRPLSAGVRSLSTEASDVERLVHEMSQAPRARPADFFGSVEAGQVVLRLVYALDQDQQYLVVRWPVQGTEYSSLSEVDPAFFVEECEIYEQFGVRPAGPKLLNRLVVPPHAGKDFPRMGNPPPREGRAPHARHDVTGEAIEFPFGPVRAVAQESLYMGLVTSGEEIIDLYLLQWHKHRGIERRLRGLDLGRALFFIERAEGLSCVANSLAFCRAAEAISATTVPQPVDKARAVALELERLYNHAASVAALCQATGLSVGQAQAEMALEGLLRANLAALGHRYLFGALAVGGLGRPLDAGALAKALPPAYSELRRVIEQLWSTNSFIDRLEACGAVTPEAAARLGLVGPIARASGLDIDTRRDHPFGAHATAPLKVATRERGDVLARMQVMEAEVEQSYRLCLDLAPGTAPAPAPSNQAGPGGAHQPGGSGLGWSESPRGESLVWLSLADDGRIERARLRPGTFRNWRAFDDAARSRNVFTDVPIIEASFWLTTAGFAR